MLKNTIKRIYTFFDNRQNRRDFRDMGLAIYSHLDEFNVQILIE